jgi:Skp family chaperone for outer membrane proteins
MIMKTAVVLFILTVCYIASTEQAAAPVPTGMHTYPSRSWKEMEHKIQQGMKNFQMKAEEMERKSQQFARDGGI